MLKTTAITVTKPLCILFYMSLRENRFPKFWKIAHVLPLLKKDFPSIKANFIAVILLSCVIKIMEKVVFKLVYNYFFFNTTCSINIKQVFTVIFQLLETYHSIVKIIAEGKSCCMIFCDLSKAFDRVWHKGLLFKRQTYSITGNLLGWFNKK